MRKLFCTATRLLLPLCIAMLLLALAQAAPDPEQPIMIEGWYEWAECTEGGTSLHGFAVIQELDWKPGIYDMTVLLQSGLCWEYRGQLDGNNFWATWKADEFEKFTISRVNGRLQLKNQRKHSIMLFFVKALHKNPGLDVEKIKVEKIKVEPKN